MLTNLVDTTDKERAYLPFVGKSRSYLLFF